MNKSFYYSLRYIIVIIVCYSIFGLNMLYKPNFWLLGLIPYNFLVIKFAILYKIEKDRQVDKYYILFSLILFTSIFNVVFLSLMKVNIWVVILATFINALELFFFDLSSSDKKKIITKKKVTSKNKKK